MAAIEQGGRDADLCVVNAAVASALIGHGGEPRFDIDRRLGAEALSDRQPRIVIIVTVAATCGRLAVNDRRGGFQPVGEVVELIARRPVGDDADVDPGTGLGVVAARQAHQA